MAAKKSTTNGAPAGMQSLKKGAETASHGPIVILRPSELAKEGRTGTIASGVYEGAKPNKFNPAKSDYFIRGNDDTLYILNETSSLREQLGQPGVEGMTVEVVYNGKIKTKSGKSFHDFEVFAKAN